MAQININGISGGTAPYTIKVYQVGNSIPIFTDITFNADYSGTFNHINGQNYYAVIEKEGCVTYISSDSSLNCISCNCPSGYSVSVDGTYCVRILTTSPTITQQGITPTNGSTSTAYGTSGVRIFKVGQYNLDGSPTNGTDSLDYIASATTNPVRVFWAGNQSTGGRLNLKGTWAINSNNSAYIGTLSYCYTMNISLSKTYYIGIAGDDYCSIRVNGNTILQQVQIMSPPYTNFWYWNIYPVQLQAGTNIIEMTNTNVISEGAFAAEIYDNNVSQLSTATSESNLNILFTTGDYRVGSPKYGEGFCSKYSCPSGYVLDNSDTQNIVCKRVETANCS